MYRLYVKRLVSSNYNREIEIRPCAVFLFSHCILWSPGSLMIIGYFVHIVEGSRKLAT